LILGDLIEDLGCNYDIAISGLIAWDCNEKSKIHRWILGFNWTKNKSIKNNWIQIELTWD
jgi:hypothetical protein